MIRYPAQQGAGRADRHAASSSPVPSAGMCGIIGYTGDGGALPVIVDGLARLEYRGYDSAGVVVVSGSAGAHQLRIVKRAGKLATLKAAVEADDLPGSCGLGHTRWATHGGVTEENAHPLAGCEAPKLSIVLNGIVENYRELKESLETDGHEFNSETDAEVVVHLIERNYEGDLGEAVRAAYGELEGHFAFVVIHDDHPDMLVGARRQCPLVVGVGDGEMFLASAVAAFLR